jgi:hypothetical protein
VMLKELVLVRPRPRRAVACAWPSRWMALCGWRCMDGAVATTVRSWCCARAHADAVRDGAVWGHGDSSAGGQNQAVRVLRA